MAKRQKVNKPEHEQDLETENEDSELDDDLDVPSSDDDIANFSDDFDDIDEEGGAPPRRSTADDLKAIEPEVALRANPKRGKYQRKEVRPLDGVSTSRDLSSPEVALKVWKKLEKLYVDSEPKTYQVNQDYFLDDIISHPTFGRGYVVEILSNTKFAVLFKEGVKRLMYNIQK